MAALADSKTNVRAAAVATLNTFIKETSLKDLFVNEIISTALTKGGLGGEREGEGECVCLVCLCGGSAEKKLEVVKQMSSLKVPLIQINTLNLIQETQMSRWRSGPGSRPPCLKPKVDR